MAREGLTKITDYLLSVKNISTVLIVFGLFLICFLWTSVLYIVTNERAQDIENAVKETSNFARAFEEHTVRTIKSADQTVLFLKYQYEKEEQNISIPRYIEEGRLTSQPFVLLSVIDANGDLAVSSQVPFVPSNLKDREHFMVHQAYDTGTLFISKPVFGRSSGKWSLQMTRRINQPDGSFGGVAVVSVDPYYFTEFYKQVQLGKNSSIALVGQDGIVRVRQSGQATSVGQDIRESPIMERMLQQDEGSLSFTSTLDGIKRFYSFRAVKNYPFFVVVGREEEEVLSPSKQRAQIYCMIVSLVTIVVLVFILFLMAANRRQKEAEIALVQANNTLEHKVEQRTNELFALNQELVGTNKELNDINAELQSEVSARKKVQIRLMEKNEELERAYDQLKHAQSQIIHQEKMASIGQLAAGIAHEINNPMGFISSNLETLHNYVIRLTDVLSAYRELQQADLEEASASLLTISHIEKQKKISYILDDLPALFSETEAGVARVGDIVKALRLFSRADTMEAMEDYNLNEGIANSLVIARNEIKHIAEVQTNLAELPLIKAFGGQINQVLLNIILNAVYAIKDKGEGAKGLIAIRTYHDSNYINCDIKDNGCGMPEHIIKDIFNPFFTTKPVGEGSGLGLSISYDIIINKHHGQLLVDSQEGLGTTFTIRLPRA